ncbi:MAG TPA: YidC/Oxa1 family membrane protein insertase [Patescibacteria group bacterium]|nr:YidC/Oxa1 family membrane protein insertase [Patescibacteria group bacterium]
MKELLKVLLYKPLYNILVFLAWLIPGHSVGWAIIALTLLVRLALWPSSMKATRAQKKMRDLAPEIAKLKEQHKGDRQGEAAATMALYKKYGVSPWGSCLPLLIQLPILIVLYRVFMNGLGVRTDLLYGFTPLADVNTMWLGLDLGKLGSETLPILPILAGIAQFYNSWQMKQLHPAAAAKAKDGKPQEDFSRMLSMQMLYIMPVFTVIIGLRLPGVLALYWLITTLFSILQTWLVMRGNSKMTKHGHPELAEGSQIAKLEEADSGVSDSKASKPEVQTKRPNLLRRLKQRKDVTVEIRRKDK